MSEKKHLIMSSGVLSFFTLVSRLTGLLRDMMIATLLGASRVSDVFWLAFTIPNLARSILGEGALSTFVVPVFTRRRHESEKSAITLANRLINIIALMGLLLTVLGVVCSAKFFLIFGGYGILSNVHAEFGGIPPHIVSLVDLGGQLTKIMFPYLVLLAVAAVMMGLCNGLGSFARPALGAAILNLAMLAAGVAALFFHLDPMSATIWLAAAVLVGACLRIVIMVPILWRAGWRWKPEISFTDPGVRDVLRMMSSGLYGMSLSHVSLAMTGVLAAFAGPGVKTYLTHGSRLISLPMALTSAAMATAMLPRITSFLIKKEYAELSALIGFSRRVDLIFMMPAALGLMFFGLPIIQMLFQHGEWTPDDSIGVYWVLFFLAPSLLVLGSVRLMVPLFYARQDAMTPVRAATAAIVVSLSTGTVATFVLDGRQIGLAVANLLGAITNYLVLKRRIKKELGPVLAAKGTTEAFLKCLSAGFIAIGGCALIHFSIVQSYGLADNSFGRGFQLIPLMGLSAVLYFVLCRTFNVPDSDHAFEMIRHRLRPPGAPSAPGAEPKSERLIHALAISAESDK